MEYNIEIKNIEKIHIENNTFKHYLNKTNKKQLLPYTTKRAKANKNDLMNFMEVVSEFSRMLVDRKQPKQFSVEKYKETIMRTLKAGDKTVFSSIIDELFIHESKLANFHPYTLNYICSSTYNKKLGKFLFDVLFVPNENINSLIEKAYVKEADNVLLNLMVEYLPDLVPISKEKIQYRAMIPYVQKSFMKDLEYLLADRERVVNDIERLLKFYYMFYISQLSLIVGKTFDANIDEPSEVYFALDWENTGKGRRNIEMGWEMIESNVAQLFSHINLLTLINYNDEDKQYSYLDLKNRIDSFNEDEKQSFLKQMNLLVELYKKNTSHSEWANFDNYYVPYFSNECYEIVNKLQKMISFQFSYMSENYQEHYGSWFKEFCSSNFLKVRGKYGYVLNLSEENVIFLTRLCIGNLDKIKLNDLYAEFRSRGICLDNDSKLKLVQLYEKLNILEKKSDSGDAQYVRAIL